MDQKATALTKRMAVIVETMIHKGVNRSSIVHSLKSNDTEWDVLIIGGGATGLGTAVDAASRGYKTVLLERHDFAKGTSSRSTKLIHGGVRYLRQGNISLVFEALKERGRLLKNAPHLVTNQSFVVPNYKWWEKPYYGLGLAFYDLLAGKLGFGKAKRLSKQKTLEHIPGLRSEKLRGGVLYHDGQFDDARLAVNLMQTVYDHDGIAVNYLDVVGLIKIRGKICGVVAEDRETSESFEIKAKAVVNATGIFTDSIRRMDDASTAPLIRFSQGIHIVLDKEFYPGECAMMIPKTEDGRVLFAVPWHGKVIVGTTDTPVDSADIEPKALRHEVEFLLDHAGRYLTKAPKITDIRSVFAGLRPLVNSQNGKKTKSISREHTLLTDESGLVTITGGKWTTYRKMAEEAVDRAAAVAKLPPAVSVTPDLKIHGWTRHTDQENPYTLYGSDAAEIRKLASQNGAWGEKLHKDLPYNDVEVIWAVRHEMARTVEDVLSRRTRALLLDAEASQECAPKVAALMAGETGKDKQWIRDQVSNYHHLARQYMWNAD